MTPDLPPVPPGAAQVPPGDTRHHVIGIRAVVRGPAERRGERWSQAVVGWLDSDRRMFCDQHPTARDCEHIRIVREAIR